VGEDESDRDPLWEQELARRKGEDEGFNKGFGKGLSKGGYKGGYKGQKGGDKGYQGKKGKDPTKGRKGQGGKAAVFASAWAGWGATGGNAVETDTQENDNTGSWTLLILSVVMMLMGMILASRTFRRPLAGLLRGLASMIYAGDVSASVALEPVRVLHADPASAGAMPQRAGFEDTTRLRGTRRDAAPAESSTGEPAMPLTADQGTQSLNKNQWFHWEKYRCHMKHMKTQTRWLVDSGASEDIGTQTVDKHFWLDKMTVYELKTHCKDEGLQTTGLKADLIWRIEQHRANLIVSGGHASAR
jgi:hypothetical protein